MNFNILQELSEFVGFDGADRDHLLRLGGWLAPRLDDLAEDFYRSLLRRPGPRRVFRDEAQVSLLKETLKDWARKLCDGPHDEEYVRLRARIGRVHVQIGLPQRYMHAGMNIIRQFLTRLIDERSPSAVEARETSRALHRILDIELCLMLETYHEDLLGKLARNERLAALGAVAVTVNHELKNPLGVLKTSVDALRRICPLTEDLPSAEKVHRHLEKLDRNLNQMQRNISSLLEFARSAEPVFADCDIHAVIDEAVEEVPVPPGVTIVRRLDRSIRTLQADPIQLGRVLVNLVQNACEVLGDSGGTVAIQTRAVEGGIRISVEDTGPGVPSELRQQIFEPLWTGRPGGTGMGLAICRNLVEAHRGKIWVESPGTGAIFHIEIPQSGESVRGPGRT